MSSANAEPPARIAMGEGIELRRLEPADADAIFAVVAANREHLDPWLPWVEGTHEAADTRAFLEQVEENRARGRTAAYGIWQGGELAGLIGLHDIDASNASAQIGYWLAERWQGRGLMTRAVQALVELAFRELGLGRIEIRCAAGNLRSQAIPKRLGFTYEGTLRAAQRLHGKPVDLRIYGLLREEWERLRAASAEQVERRL
ncbi:MAG: GNAT family N-acetyltransferase [Bryobacteraceae bacterium]|nr:GNAT family N-acetyltransferase [Bryobacteraceae bacterium]